MLPPALKRKRILVVDDDAKTLSWVSSVLRAHDYDVITADSGPQALELSHGRAEKIDLLLSDFQMPGMTGIDLATQLSHERPGLAVLLMSVFPNGMLVLNEGWHFLSKPFIPSAALRPDFRAHLRESTSPVTGFR